jgi:hypothetical protein
MLFRQRFLDGIRTGSITLAFRRWRRPSVKSGGTLLTPIGQLEIAAVERVSEASISHEDARRAGYASIDTLLADLRHGREGHVYRIQLGTLRADPRIALRNAVSDRTALASVIERLTRLDHRAPGGAWTSRVLDIIATHPAVRAGHLCDLVGMEKPEFKVNVRKLKGLGLTESLDTGYRLSPLGQAVRAALRSGVRMRV